MQFDVDVRNSHFQLHCINLLRVSIHPLWVSLLANIDYTKHYSHSNVERHTPTFSDALP